MPSKEEWEYLIKFAGGEEAAGKNLKANSGWNKDGYGTDKFGFWWSTTEYECNTRRAYSRFINCRSDDAYSQYQDKLCFLSVRCVQNSTPCY